MFDILSIQGDGASGADAQMSFMNDGSSKWTIGNDGSDNNSFVLRKGYGAFGTTDVLVITQNGQADLNLPMLGNQGGLTVGKKAAEATNNTFSIVRSIGAHSIDTRYVSGFWAQSFGAYNAGAKLGNIGIGTSGPTEKLVVNKTGWGSTEFTGNDVQFTNDDASYIWSKDPAGYLSFGSGSRFEDLTIATDGNVGIGTTTPPYLLSVNGDAAKPGSQYWTIWSDKTLKDVKRDYSKGLDDILQLNPVVYSYKDNTPQNLPSGKEYTGLVAQEVQKRFSRRPFLKERMVTSP